MTTITGAAVIQTFLSVVGVFFILYLIGSPPSCSCR